MKQAAIIMAFALASCSDGYGTLIPGDMIVGDAIPVALSDAPANALAGREIFVERERGHCVLCHQVSGLDALFQGDVGPDLSDVGARLNPGQIRLRIVDASILNPDTVMPPYYRIHDLHQVAPERQGQPVLSAQEIEHLVAYLSGLEG